MKKFILTVIVTVLALNQPVFAATTSMPYGADSLGANTSTPYGIDGLTTDTSTPYGDDGLATPRRALIKEPMIRVGLSKVPSFTFRSEATYHLYSGRVERMVIPAGVTTIVAFKNGRYNITGESVDFSSDEYLKFVPDDLTSVFTLDGYYRRFENGKINYDQYRGILEYRYSAKSKAPYLINELPMEEYVAGIAEVAKSDPVEYVTAMIVAARTYAYSQMGAPASDKHLFDVYGSTIDQLYLGYVSEQNHPNVVEAAERTAGQMVTYKSKPIVANYFGNSNGKTLTWKNPPRPYLKSVVAKYDKGRRKYGHGYGISMRDARLRAIKDGWTYEQILKYYYTGVEIERVY